MRPTKPPQSGCLVSGLGDVGFCLREDIWGAVTFPEDCLHDPSCLRCPRWRRDTGNCVCLWLDPRHLGEVDLSVWIDRPCSYYVHTQTWSTQRLRSYRGKGVFSAFGLSLNKDLAWQRSVSSVTSKSLFGSSEGTGDSLDKIKNANAPFYRFVWNPFARVFN